ncbi:MAG: hypothetical protein HY711_04815, partial [Candidatus Melainabacteria bacterium]|nr:hypothetical protein [Candidatus Melainabacteria bacterium]
MTFPTASQYEPGQVAACHAVLIELVHILGDFIDDMAIVGGWVPLLLIQNAAEEHVGSMDVDLALDIEHVSEDAYATINKILTRHGYRQNEASNAQFKYFKNVVVSGQTYEVEVDLLTGEYGGDTGKNRRHQPIQDVKALKARGADMVFARTETITVSGDLPGDAGKDTVKCKIAGVVPFIVMKGIVIVRRKKEKDAYDLDFVLRNYPGSIEAIAQLMAPDINHGVVREALSNIDMKFQSVEHWGPLAVANFREIADIDERTRIKRMAFEIVQALLDKTLRAKSE